ncbi:zinc-binding dehydrogenase [Paenibacillus ehimensis]|uniref:zinc-binding dehydrogenase n=1 Tax=Paenibacillus ehimensis TaxID=79264 RepID=UPI000FD902BA|nr:zinc-binding dehydrogenase [Paenibacillus ehimensis]
MKALLHYGATGTNGLRLEEVEDKHPGPGEVKVRIKAAGLNHRDLFVLARRTGSEPPFIPGSDGAGLVEAVGSGVDHVRIGDEVIINPTLGWHAASEVPEVPDILGSPTDGTFAQSTIVPAVNVEPKPAYLTWEEAGVLPLAALTAYRALFTRGQVQQGEHVLLPGIGSGVATYALAMAKAAGAEVTVTSRDAGKRRKALELGADAAIDSHGDWDEALEGRKVDLIVESIGPATFPQYFKVLRPGGRIVSLGATSGDTVEIPLRPFLFPQFSFLGTSMGSTEEFKKMLQLVDKHRIRPVVDATFPLAEAVRAFQRMQEGRQFGKIGLIPEEEG